MMSSFHQVNEFRGKKDDKKIREVINKDKTSI